MNSQKGSVPVWVIVLAVIGIIVGIYLITSGTGFFPSAQEDYDAQYNTDTSGAPEGPVLPGTYIDK
jgi:F0F1-type ATP synthase assembly protein I